MSSILGLWPFLLVAIGSSAIGYLARPRPRVSTSWRVQVAPALRASYDYDRYGGTEPVQGTIAVRLVKDKSSMPVAVLKTSDEGFEDQLTLLVAVAEERAAALNAVGRG